MPPDAYKEHAYYRRLYQGNDDPWNYAGRAAETLRYAEIQEILLKERRSYGRALDIGCGPGFVTRRLLSFAQEVVAIDVSRDAVASVRERFGGKGLRVAVAGMPGLPFPPSSFDLVIAADVIHEAVVPERRSEVLREISRLLKDDGSALLSDYLKPADFEEFRGQVSRNGFKIVRIIPMHDRTWYQFESWFKSIRGWGWVKKLLASHAIARALKFPSRLMGFSGSRHVLILAQKGWGHSHD